MTICHGQLMAAWRYMSGDGVREQDGQALGVLGQQGAEDRHGGQGGVSGHQPFGVSLRISRDQGSPGGLEAAGDGVPPASPAMLPQ